MLAIFILRIVMKEKFPQNSTLKMARKFALTPLDLKKVLQTLEETPQESFDVLDKINVAFKNDKLEVEMTLEDISEESIDTSTPHP